MRKKIQTFSVHLFHELESGVQNFRTYIHKKNYTCSYRRLNFLTTQYYVKALRYVCKANRQLVIIVVRSYIDVTIPSKS